MRIGPAIRLFVAETAAIFGNSWFAVPLFLFKLFIDIAQPIQFFLGGGEAYNDPHANLLRPVQVKSSFR